MCPSISKRITAPKTSGNLFMKLSGEIRNQIYELVVSAREGPFRGDEYTTWIRARHLPDEVRKSKAGLHTTRAWREPALLLVSKQIRQEAMSYYYSERTFNICLKSASELPDARDFIFNKAYEARTVQPQNGEVSREKTTIKYVLHVAGGSWKDLISWFALAELLRYTSEAEAETCKLMWHNRGTYIRAALQELVEMGNKARKVDLRFVMLQQRFHHWARDVVNHGHRERIKESVRVDLKLELKELLTSIKEKRALEENAAP